MKIFETRNNYIQSLNSNLIMCEIGVFAGDFSRILFQSQPKELHLIDPFFGLFCSGDKDGKNIKRIDLNSAYQCLLNEYKNFTNVFIHKGTSLDVLKNFADDYFDFMYIDANHEYNYVKQDLEICKHKTKNNGIISGHDYNQDTFPGVYKAVNDFCKNNNTKIDSITKDGSPTFSLINNK